MAVAPCDSLFLVSRADALTSACDIQDERDFAAAEDGRAADAAQVGLNSGRAA
jgi:hypothetical protein